MGPELLVDRAERACSAAGCDQGRPNGDGVKGEASDEVKVRLPGEDLAGLLKKNGCAVQAKPSCFVGKPPRGLVVRLVRELECAPVDPDELGGTEIPKGLERVLWRHVDLSGPVVWIEKDERRLLYLAVRCQIWKASRVTRLMSRAGRTGHVRPCVA